MVDTTVFVNVLRVPTKDSHHAAVLADLEAKLQREEVLFLPMATIFETGNHIGQCGNGNQRRSVAQRFVKQVNQAIQGESPFRPIDFLEAGHLRQWLEEFPDCASRGMGLGDLSIIHDWKRLCRLNESLRVYIWSLDQHLAGYSQAAKI
ncbi:MAG: hypothetical protein WDZ51_01710 [Pirellulaceae bacterium]